LKDLVSGEVFELFQMKLRDWNLMMDPLFRWCAHVCAPHIVVAAAAAIIITVIIIIITYYYYYYIY